MAIIGVGTDVVDVTRISRLIDRGGRRFLERWCRPTEVEFCLAEVQGAQHAAALFATKEAAFKSLRTPGTGPLPWHDIEITSNPGQSPRVHLHGALRELATCAGVSTFHVSMSHNTHYAMASVVAVSGADHDSV